MGTGVLPRDLRAWPGTFARLPGAPVDAVAGSGVLSGRSRHPARATSRLVSADNDMREFLADALPGAVQPFLTWLTAKPSDAERCRARGPIYHVWTAFIWVGAGVAASVLAVSGGGWLLALLPPALVATTCGLGKLQAVVYHHCAHGTVFEARAANFWMGEFISILLLIKRFAAYRREHLRHHFAKVLLTEEDEFLQFLQERLGMRAGMRKAVLRRKMLVSLVSPVFYAQSLVGRAKGCFLSDEPVVNALAMAAWAAAAAGVTYFGVWWEFAVIWLIPVVVLFQAATMFRVLCEHRFPGPERIARRDARFICESTVGVIPASPPPPARNGFAGLWGWLGWWTKMLTVHLFSRIFVLVGDAPAHDYHHRNPSSRKWANYIFERHRDARAGCAEYPVNYLEYWGLFRAIDDILETLSRLPPYRGGDRT